MSRAKRKRLEKEEARRLADTESEDAGQGKRLILIVALVFVVLIGAIIGISRYFSEDQKYLRIDIIEVDDQKIGMDYFIRRCYATGSDPMSALTGLTKELVLKQEAAEMGMEISDARVDDRMMENAQGSSDTAPTQSEFREWYKQRLNETKLTDDEYRDIVRTTIIAETFYDAIVDMTPTTGEQVHFSYIKTDTQPQADELYTQLEAGADFAALAMEYSIDSTTRNEGGDKGWVPRGVFLDARYDDVIFDSLEAGQYSEVLPYYNTEVDDTSSSAYIDYYIFLVTEKSDNREIDAAYIDSVRNDAYNAWIGERLTEHSIKYHGIKNGFDSETYSWINWQLQKMTGDDDEES